MDIFRLICVLFFLPAHIALCVFLADYASQLLGIWNYYIIAVLLPLSALPGTWFIAPFYKSYFVVFVYGLGAFLAYALAFPVYYPEGHELAYSATLKPFILTMACGAITSMFLLVFTWRSHNKALKSDAERAGAV
jgi:hypothetical protein